VAGLLELTGHVGSEITTLVQELHAASNPAALLGADVVERSVYAAIRLSFSGARRAAAAGGLLAGDELSADSWLDVQSALNGAFGHLFEETGSAFALPMTLIHQARRPRHAARLLVFIHGLCMNERGWHRPEHARFCDWARERLDADVAYVRYNTGLRISTNGGRLANLLERKTGEEEILLIGHSMGGLVARSALHQAGEQGFAWAGRVSRLACLGSPHEGTSLERLGNDANRMLGSSPWTRPFMRLGNLRSDGIRDLRFGHLVEADWRDRTPDDPGLRHSRVELASHVDHLHIAAIRHERASFDPLGDWLVPVESALALNIHPADRVRRELFHGIGHLSLLGDERVYRVLRRWMEQPLSPCRRHRRG
jgi:pimeloyl-ACP methyl ester carboxylesterase